MAAMQAFVVASLHVDHFLLHDDLAGHHFGFLRAAGGDGSACGAAQRTTDDRAVAAANRRAHCGAGAAAERAADHRFGVDCQDGCGNDGQGCQQE
jgi:hypothetical protein